MVNARLYLEKIADAGARIRLNQERAQRLHESLLSLSAPMDKEQVSHTKNVTLMQDTIARIIDMEREIDHQTDELLALHQKARVYFNMPKASSRPVLTSRYLDNMEYADVAKAMNYAESTMYRVLREAIAELQELFNSLGIEIP